MTQTLFGAAWFGAVGLAVTVMAVQSAGAQTPNSASHRPVTSIPTQDSKARVAGDSNSSAADGATSAMDSDLADRIRRNVVADRNLSSYAAKITIVASDGDVRLTGMIQNEGEKAQIGAKAAAVAGQRHVLNDLRVMTNVPDGTALRALLEQASLPRAATVAAAN